MSDEPAGGHRHNGCDCDNETDHRATGVRLEAYRSQAAEYLGHGDLQAAEDQEAIQEAIAELDQQLIHWRRP